jgi:hypothetical protein
MSEAQRDPQPGEVSFPNYSDLMPQGEEGAELPDVFKDLPDDPVKRIRAWEKIVEQLLEDAAPTRSEKVYLQNDKPKPVDLDGEEDLDAPYEEPPFEIQHYKDYAVTGGSSFRDVTNNFLGSGLSNAKALEAPDESDDPEDMEFFGLQLANSISNLETYMRNVMSDRKIFEKETTERQGYMPALRIKADQLSKEGSVKRPIDWYVQQMDEALTWRQEHPDEIWKLPEWDPDAMVEKG